MFRKYFQAELLYKGIFSSKGGIFQKKGLSLEDLESLKKEKYNVELAEILNRLDENTILIDTTASEKTVSTIEKVLKNGGYAIMSNKKPLSAEYSAFEKLHKLGKSKLYYETAVGAGLPVISTLKELIFTGDEVIQIEGCFSGTLGYLCSELEKGTKYSTAVKTAMDLGFTEPDPRDDLSGQDVARKALILSRIIGEKLELEDIEIEPMFDKKFADLSIQHFINNLSEQDDFYKEKFVKALTNHNTWKYTAKIKNGKIKVCLTEGEKSSPIGSLDGPDNIVVFQTKRYMNNSLVIQGPGAGIDVTAAGVVGDVLKIIRN
jgi:homoserine dehydrogenase